MPVSKPRKDKKKYGMGGQGKVFDLELPSLDDDGDPNVCRARRLGVQGLIKLGILDSMDTLTSLVATGITEISGKITAADAAKMAGVADKMDEAMGLIDSIVIAAVVEPRVYPVPKGKTDDKTGEVTPAPPRDPELLYADDVDLDDKMFIMDWTIGGSADYRAFRQSTEDFVGDVADGPGVPDATEPAAGS
jgi:hypothetical protein